MRLAAGFRRCDIRDYNQPFSLLLRLGSGRVQWMNPQRCDTTDSTQLRLMSRWPAVIAAARRTQEIEMRYFCHWLGIANG